MNLTETHDEGLGVEVILTEGGETAPNCVHGPTLLFEKLCVGGKKGRRFYACSACRDRKDCNFFQWEDDKVSEARLQARAAEIQLKKPRFTQQEFAQRFEKFLGLPEHQRRFCEDCQLLLLPAEVTSHSAHKSKLVTGAQLRRPSALLRPLDNKKSNAQYLFTDRSTQFLLDTLVSLGYRKVLCVGTPRLQELIKVHNLERKEAPLKSLLLDIDFRYAQFYSQDEFCHYNMFNHHFFGGEACSAIVEAFLSESEGGHEVVMVADPPFGGLVKPLAKSFSLISQTWRKLRNSESSDAEVPMMWTFPYFFEPRILECLPSLVMLDYQVDYDNHPLYKHGKTGRKQSPVRIFTNIPAREVILPKEEGYRFCSICERYVWVLNKHCTKCNLCPSKDGRGWKHCAVCEKCVKPSWKHCQSCARCALPDHPCGQDQGNNGCFNCGSLAHKRKSCPLQRAPKIKRYLSGAKKGFNQKSSQAKAKRKSGAARRAKKLALQSAEPQQCIF